MKLNKKLGFIASLIVAMMPKGSKADLFLCAACPVGTYGKGDSLNCTPCPVGQYQDIVGQGSCKSCPVGKYQDKTGQGSCKTCPMGQYQDKTGQSSCKTCPSGTKKVFYKCTGLMPAYPILPCSINETEESCKAWSYCTPEYIEVPYFSNPSRTGCVSADNLTLDNFTQIASGNKSGSLQSGFYLIRLMGGTGGQGDCSVGSKGDGGSPGLPGGKFNYIFYLPQSASYQLLVGNNGRNIDCFAGGNCCSGGGGGTGSYLRLTFNGKDYYFAVAGGKGGGAYYINNEWDTYHRDGEKGTGIKSPINIITDYNKTSIYSIYTNELINSRQTHTSNVPKIPDCGSSCAILYKLK